MRQGIQKQNATTTNLESAELPSISRSSAEWWSHVKQDPEKFTEWLKKQYHGEVTAAERIERFRDEHYKEGTEESKVLSIIAEQERAHAEWVGGLLESRGIAPEVLQKEERYWNETLDYSATKEEIAATGSLAEQMRLERLELIAGDSEADEDIRDVFNKILPQERFHAKAFEWLAGGRDSEAMKNRREAHVRGLEALGLIPKEAI